MSSTGIGDGERASATFSTTEGGGVMVHSTLVAGPIFGRCFLRGVCSGVAFFFMGLGEGEFAHAIFRVSMSRE